MSRHIKRICHTSNTNWWRKRTDIDCEVIFRNGQIVHHVIILSTIPRDLRPNETFVELREEFYSFLFA